MNARASFLWGLAFLALFGLFCWEVSSLVKQRDEAIDEFTHCDGMFLDLEAELYVCEDLLKQTCAGETYACD